MTTDVKAYVLMNVNVGSSVAVLDGLKTIPHVVSVASTTGLFDIIVKIAVDKIEELEQVISSDIHAIPGIKKTETQVVIKELTDE